MTVAGSRKDSFKFCFSEICSFTVYVGFIMTKVQMPNVTKSLDTSKYMAVDLAG